MVSERPRKVPLPTPRVEVATQRVEVPVVCRIIPSVPDALRPSRSAPAIESSPPIYVLPATLRRLLGVVVPMPIFPVSVTVNTEPPADEAMVTMSLPAVPCTVNLDVPVEVPIPSNCEAVFAYNSGILEVPTLKSPHTSSLAEGVVVPTPTLPLLEARYGIDSSISSTPSKEVMTYPIPPTTTISPSGPMSVPRKAVVPAPDSVLRSVQLAPPSIEVRT